MPDYANSVGRLNLGSKKASILVHNFLFCLSEPRTVHNRFRPPRSSSAARRFLSLFAVCKAVKGSRGLRAGVGWAMPVSTKWA